MAQVLHLVPAEAWAAHDRATAWAPPSLATEGFVHCTGDDETLLRVANTFYRGVPGDLLVLSVDEDALTSPLVWEDPVPAPPAGSATTAFPHVYGPIDPGAVVGLRRLVRDPDGTCTGFAPA